MPIRPILRFPDNRLTHECVAVGPVGLAAPQIGVNLRLAVVDASDERGQVIRMADPGLYPIVEEGTYLSLEGSPCLPSITDKVERNSKVIAEYTDENGERVKKELEGLWAASAQHQLDHLNGKLYIDKLSRVKRDMAVLKYMKKRGKR